MQISLGDSNVQRSSQGGSQEAEEVRTFRLAGGKLCVLSGRFSSWVCGNMRCVVLLSHGSQDLVMQNARPFGGMGTFATVGTGAICSASESGYEGIKIKFDLSNTLLCFDLLVKIVPIEVVSTELEEFTIRFEMKDPTFI